MTTKTTVAQRVEQVLRGSLEKARAGNYEPVMYQIRTLATMAGASESATGQAIKTLDADGKLVYRLSSQLRRAGMVGKTHVYVRLYRWKDDQDAEPTTRV
jgi:hypothetical protein